MGLKKKVNLRKLILGLSAVGMLSLTLSTSTYAWFKLNATAKVENFDFEVIGGKGFMVSIDGGTYTNDLKTEQIEKAIAVAYGNGVYELGYESDADGKITESDVLYEINYNSNNELVKRKVENVDEVLEGVMKNIELLPTTSSDGRSFTDLYKAPVTTTSGRFVEFSVYFKTTSTKESDNLKYDIYLDGYGGYDNDGNKILPTKFTSAITPVQLMAGMNTFEYIDDGTNVVKQLKNYAAGEKINVYSSNAARISVTTSNKQTIEAKYQLTNNYTFVEGKKYFVTEDNGATFIEATVVPGDDITPDTYYEFVDTSYTYTTDEDSTLIYEINDTEKKNSDLGSYATDYDEVATDYTNDYYMYSSKCNAMYTYYNNLRRSSPLKPMDYAELPKTIKSLPAESSDKINSSDYNAITTVESGKDEKKVTFRIWLEGWDADCFDGLANSIDVRLSFASKRVD